MELTGPQRIIQIRVWLGQTYFAIYGVEIRVGEYEWLSNCRMFRNAVPRLKLMYFETWKRIRSFIWQSSDDSCKLVSYNPQRTHSTGPRKSASNRLRHRLLPRNLWATRPEQHCDHTNECCNQLSQHYLCKNSDTSFG
jgi:hypothetical protein